jgi:Carboxypeptidase regulatory-like domain
MSTAPLVFAFALVAVSTAAAAQAPPVPAAPAPEVAPAPAPAPVDAARASAVSGRVKIGDGTPLAGVVVALREGKRLALPKVTTGPKGEYRFAGLPPGLYTARVEVGIFLSPRFPVELAPGERPFDLTLPGSFVRGRVLLPDGKPAAGALVHLGEGAVELVQTTAQDDGRFIFGFIEGTNAYWVSAGLEALAASPTPVTVPQGAIRDIDLHLARAASLRGRLLGLTPDELPTATVEIEQGEGQPSVTSKVGKDGRYQLAGLAAGTWQVIAMVHDESGSAKHAEVKVTLAPGDDKVVDIPFPYHEVNGFARDENGAPLAGCNLQILGQGGDSATTQTAIDGSFSVDLRDGAYSLLCAVEDEPGVPTVYRSVENLTVQGENIPEAIVAFQPDNS